MANGDLWQLPDGREAIEVSGSSGGQLRVAPKVENWPFPGPPEIFARRLCTRLPMRYLHGQVPQDEEALF